MLFFVDTAGCCPVSAANVIGFDFQAGNGVGSSISTQHERIVTLITICFLCIRIDFNHPSPDNA